MLNCCLTLCTRYQTLRLQQTENKGTRRRDSNEAHEAHTAHWIRREQRKSSSRVSRLDRMVRREGELGVTRYLFRLSF